MEVGIVTGKAAALGTLGVALAVLAAPTAGADPDTAPVDPPAPLALVEAQPAAEVPVPPAEGVPAANTPASVTPPDGIPHLTTPDNLPPGTTQTPTRSESTTTEYLKDIWHAVRNQDVTMGEALVLIAQRPMDSKGVLQDMTPHSPPAGTVPGPETVAQATPRTEAPALTPLPESAPAPVSEAPES